MSLLNAIVLTLIKMFIVVCFAGTGVFLGITFRKRKDKKNNKQDI